MGSAEQVQDGNADETNKIAKEVQTAELMLKSTRPHELLGFGNSCTLLYRYKRAMQTR